MMQAFRNAAKPVIVVITISFFGWLVWDLSGLSSGGSSILSRTTVGKINGQSVDIRSFDQRVQNAINERQQRTGGNLGLDQVAEIRDQVWEQVIQEVLFASEYERRGLTVSAAEVAEAIRNVPLPELRQSPDLQTNGQFDPEKYQRWLASSSGQSVIPYLEAQYRDQILQSKLFRSVMADVFVSDAALWERYRDEQEQVSIGLVRIDPEAHLSSDAVTVTPDEARAYYTRNREQFRRESADTVSGNNGGDLGELTTGQVVPEFAAAARTLPLNAVSDPVLTAFGYHILQVDSRKGDTFRARHILIPIEITGEHRDQLDAVADSLEALAAEKLERVALDTAARALNRPIGRVGPVVRGTRVTVPEAGLVPDAGVWAFQAKVGEHSPVIESDNAFFVFRLDSVHAEGIPPFEQARAEAERRAGLARREAKALELAGELRQRAASVPLQQAARDLGFEYREVGPFARLTAPLPHAALIGAAFGVPVGEVSPPIPGDAGPEGRDHSVYLVKVQSRMPADSAQFAANLAAVREQALQAARRSRVQQFVSALRESAKVSDYRSEIYRTAAQTAELRGPVLPVQ